MPLNGKKIIAIDEQIQQNSNEFVKIESIEHNFAQFASKQNPNIIFDNLFNYVHQEEKEILRESTNPTKINLNQEKNEPPNESNQSIFPSDLEKKAVGIEQKMDWKIASSQEQSKVQNQMQELDNSAQYKPLEVDPQCKFTNDWEFWFTN